MLKPALFIPSLLLATVLTAATASSADDSPAASPTNSDGKAYTLTYKFTAGDDVRTKVTQQVAIKTKVQGVSQTAQTVSISHKTWRITGVDEGGNVTLIHAVDSVDMRQKMEGRAEIRYNSLKDKEPPEGFKDVAAALGKPLTQVTINPRGKIVNRKELYPQPNSTKGQIVPRLPDRPVMIGDSWVVPEEVPVKLPGGGVKSIKIRDRHELESVENGIAVIDVQTQILTPIDDPKIEVQVIQHFTTGKIHFDVARGRIVKKVIDLNKRVVNFNGPGTYMHYVARLTETTPAGTTASLP